jgi:hypothetical protein
MISKGNELLQELYQRLTGLWYNEGKYKGQRFNQSQVKELIKRILKEYDDTNIEEYNRADNNQ